MRPLFKTILALASVPMLWLASAVHAAELVYFGSVACAVCDRWDEEVGEVYAKTQESKILPLRHHDVHDDRPDDLKFVRGVVFTPTFVAIEDGKEVGRIVGYMGDFFFWEQVDGLIKKLDIVTPDRHAACAGPSAQPTSAVC